MITVNYSITFDYIHFYTERDLMEAAPELLKKISVAPVIEGAITIRDHRNCTIEVIDELAPWIQNLCFRSVPNLSNEERVCINFFSRSGYLELTPFGDKVELKGSLTDDASYTTSELLHGLVECGKRFIECIGRIKKDDENYMANLNYIAKFEEPARLSLSE